MKIYARVNGIDLATILSFYKKKGIGVRSISHLLSLIVSDAASCLILDGLSEKPSQEEADSLLGTMRMLPSNLPIKVLSEEEKDLYNELKDAL